MDKGKVKAEVSETLDDKKTFFAKISVMKDEFLVIGKVILSISTMSFFIFASAMYNGSMAVARAVSMKMDEHEELQQIKDYRKVGYIIIVASLFYVIYAIRMLYGGKPMHYDTWVAIVIIGYTVFEFFYLIWELIKLRKSPDLSMKAVRFSSFASTLLCFVLTQAAVVSLLDQTDSRVSSAWTGIICGSLAVMTGIFVIFDSYYIQKKGIVSNIK